VEVGLGRLWLHTQWYVWAEVLEAAVDKERVCVGVIEALDGVVLLFEMLRPYQGVV
jgi:hypothetical protein